MKSNLTNYSSVNRWLTKYCQSAPPVKKRTPLVIAILYLCAPAPSCSAQAVQQFEQLKTSRCVVLELFVHNNDVECQQVVKQVQEYVKARPTLRLNKHNLNEPGKHVQRFQTILNYFGLKEASPPVIYGCNTLLLDLCQKQKGRKDQAKPPKQQRIAKRLDSLLTVDMYVRSGCSKCASAKLFVAKIKKRYPTFHFQQHDIVYDQVARNHLQQLSQRYRKQAVSVPVFHLCNQLMVGWVSDGVTGQRLESQLKYWTTPCRIQPQPRKEDDTSLSRVNSGNSSQGLSKTQNGSQTAVRSGFKFRSKPAAPNKINTEFAGIAHGNNSSTIASMFASVILQAALEQTNSDSEANNSKSQKSRASPESADDEFNAPLPNNSSNPPAAPIPQYDSTTPPPIPYAPSGDNDIPLSAQPSSDTIDVPLLGSLSKSRLGMPAFTFLVGLVDGFNPCAMWVLLFLLSVLVNLRSRAKIFAVAGTFILISGLAYFVFMAAWLNIFMLVGYLRGVQLTLGIFAVLIGSVHVKDFFAFKKGFSLSIPESAKPGIYARVRKIVTAEHLTGAIVGAVVLAVLVNIVELLCTAGLPALYTEILTMQGFPTWKNYAYLGLYNLAYMLDDAFMVTCVIVTLGRHKMQENEGRWLKLISGTAILILGLIMIFNPGLLF